MGRKTWESLPARFRPLPGRRNIVVTRNARLRRARRRSWRTRWTRRCARLADAPTAFVIGGAQLYAQALPRRSELLLTEIDRDFDGDAHFPAWPRGDFVEASRTHHDSGQGFGYQRADYRRKG